MKIDVVMITKNSATHSPLFKYILKKLYVEIPINRLIIVDDYSTDDTIKILKDFPRVEIHRVRGNRAIAREYGIKQVETNWFMFIDDDVLLPSGWFKTARKYMKSNIGLIWGWDVVANKHVRNRVKVMYYFRKAKSEYELMLRNFRHRGGCHDTLIQTEAVRDIKIPRDLSEYEDWFIKKYIEERGYRVVAPPELYCYHISNPSYTLDLGRRLARLHEKYKLQSKFITVRNMILAPFKSLAILTLTGDYKASIDQFKLYTYVFIGAFI